MHLNVSFLWIILVGTRFQENMSFIVAKSYDL